MTANAAAAAPSSVRVDAERLAAAVADIFTAPKQAITRTLLQEVIGNEIPPGVRDRAARLLASGEGRI